MGVKGTIAAIAAAVDLRVGWHRAAKKKCRDRDDPRKKLSRQEVFR
jgi:hypothetical protein